MNSLEKQLFIKVEALDQTYYFQSLVQEACRLELISDSDFAKIQVQSVQLLAMQTDRYTGGLSSSVKIETAESILQSIFYTVGIYLKNISNPDLATAALKESSMNDLYRQGRVMLEKQFVSAKRLLETLQSQIIATGNIAYVDTICTGLPGFFSQYDFEFAAHDTPAIIDYPLMSDSKSNLTGIEYINSYLINLQAENRFCQKFSADKLHSLLLGYDLHYKDLLINIFKKTLLNAFGCVIVDKYPRLLNLVPSEKQSIQRKLTQLKNPDLAAEIREVSSDLCRLLQIHDPSLVLFIEQALLNVQSRIYCALTNNQLESIFISFREDFTSSDFRFVDGVQLEDELFRNIADEIRECYLVSDKISIVKRDIHSMLDLSDILAGSCFFDTEFKELFESFGDLELALLSKLLPTHVIDNDLHFSENEKEWQDELISFLAELDIDRAESIRDLSEHIVLQ